MGGARELLEHESYEGGVRETEKVLEEVGGY